MDSLANLVPTVYSQSDADGSFAAFVEMYDSTHADQIAIMELLQTIRIPDTAPLSFILDIANALGSPFPFMSAQRWKRGNKLNNLAYIYSLRGSQNGIMSAIRYLCGVDLIVEMDVQYEWILNVARLPGPAYPISRITLKDVNSSKIWDIVIKDGALQTMPSVLTTSVSAYPIADSVSEQSYNIVVASGALQLAPIEQAVTTVQVQMQDIDTKDLFEVYVSNFELRTSPVA